MGAQPKTNFYINRLKTSKFYFTEIYLMYWVVDGLSLSILTPIFGYLFYILFLYAYLIKIIQKKRPRFLKRKIYE